MTANSLEHPLALRKISLPTPELVLLINLNSRFLHLLIWLALVIHPRTGSFLIDLWRHEKTNIYFMSS